MSIDAMNHVWKHTTYPAAQSYILQAIADVVNDTYKNHFFMGIKELAKKTKCSERTIQRALRQFEQDGWLEDTGTKRSDQFTEYIFHFLSGDKLSLVNSWVVTDDAVSGDKSGTQVVTDDESIHLLELNRTQVKPIAKTNVLHDLTKLYFDNFQGEAKPSGGQIAGQIKLLLKQITPERLGELIPLVASEGMPLTANTINFRANTKQSTQSRNVAMLRQMLQEESFERIAL